MDGILERAARDPVGALRERAQGSGRELGLAFSSYFPLEVLDALDLEGAWLPNLCSPDSPEADAELQAFVCNPVRAAVQAVLGEGLPIGLFATTTGCDARLALGGVLRQDRVTAPTVMLRLPVSVGTRTSVTQGVNAVRAFCSEAEAALDRHLDPEVLAEACLARQAVRERVSDLLERMGDEVGATAAYTAARASQVLAPRVFLDAMRASPEPPGPPRNGVRTLISGSSLPSLRLIEDIESLGAIIVADDTCTGLRGVCRRVALPEDASSHCEVVLDAIGRSLIERPWHGPVMVEPGRARAERIVAMARRRKVRVAIFVRFKFCDPHAFEVPLLSRALEEVGVTSLDLEVDREPGLSSRDAMRLQTMLERLG